MSLEDPFFIVKTEVQKSLQTSRSLYSRWCELLDDGTTARGEEYDWTVTELKNSLRSIDWDLEDLDETISIVEKNPKKFEIPDNELKERRTFVERMRATVLEMRNHINSPAVKEKEEENSRQLSQTQRPMDRYTRLNKEIEGDNQRLLDSHWQQQQAVISEQDEQLTKIGSSVGVLKAISHNIGNEMDEQSRMLTDFSHEMEHSDSKMDSVMKKMAKVMHMSNDKRQWCAIIILLAVMALVIALFFLL